MQFTRQASWSNGNFLMRLPVRSNMDSVNAGANAGSPGSPIPPASVSFSMMWTSIGGVFVSCLEDLPISFLVANLVSYVT